MDAPHLQHPHPPPLVLVTSCNREIGGHPFHIAGKKYLDAVRLAGALPVIAAPVEAAEIDALLAQADGLLLTGSPSNVHPSHFDEPVHDESLPLDPQRDAWTLPLIRRALATGMPLLGICRGTQEVNVALGGSLHQAVHEAPGHADHRGRGDTPADNYAAAHPALIQSGGLLEQVLGSTEITVNSVHGQAVKRLAEGLHVEALAPDGVIEAFSLPSAPGFNLCLQWHPEWQAAHNPDSMKLLAAFGDAVRAHRHRRLAQQQSHKSPA